MTTYWATCTGCQGRFVLPGLEAEWLCQVCLPVEPPAPIVAKRSMTKIRKARRKRAWARERAEREGRSVDCAA